MIIWGKCGVLRLLKVFLPFIHFKDDFLEGNPDLSSKVLSERLKELE